MLVIVAGLMLFGAALALFGAAWASRDPREGRSDAELHVGPIKLRVSKMTSGLVVTIVGLAIIAIAASKIPALVDTKEPVEPDANAPQAPGKRPPLPTPKETDATNGRDKIVPDGKQPTTPSQDEAGNEDPRDESGLIGVNAESLTCGPPQESGNVATTNCAFRGVGKLTIVPLPDAPKQYSVTVSLDGKQACGTLSILRTGKGKSIDCAISEIDPEGKHNVELRVEPTYDRLPVNIIRSIPKP